MTPDATDDYEWLNDKCTAMIRCRFCAFAVQLRGDTMLETVTFLRKRLAQHCWEQHPHQYQVADYEAQTAASTTDRTAEQPLKPESL